MSQILDFLRGKRVAKSAVIVNGDVVDPREIRRNTALRDLFVSTVVLRDQTQRAHWEVTGAGATFSALHEMFGEQYAALSDAADEIAERIRQLRGDVPPTYGPDVNASDRMMLATGHAASLALGHERLSARSARLARLADEADDAATVDLASRRMAAHEKAAWFLRMTAGIPDEAGQTWVVMDDLEGERLWKTSMTKAVTRDLIGETKQVVSLRDTLTKAAAPKYVKRIPTGNPKRPWRYFYAVQHGGGVHNQEHFQEGASFAHDGGHYQIHGVGADHLVVSHTSKPDKRVKMTHSELAAKLQEHHGKALAEHRAKLEKEHTEAVAAGNDKGAAKIRAEAAKVGHSIAEPKKPGVSSGAAHIAELVKIKELDDKAAASLAANPGMDDDKIRGSEKKTDDAWIKEHAARSAEHAKSLGKHPSEMMGDEHVVDHWDGGAPPKGTSKADREDADKAQQIANQRRAVRGKQIARNADKIVPKQKVEHSLDSTSANMSGAAWTPNPEGNGRGTMRVRFKGGDTYDHKDVHHRDYESVINGDHEGSPGKTYNLMIRDRHESNRVMRGTRGQTPINTEGKPEQAREENRKANIVARNETAGKSDGTGADADASNAKRDEAAKQARKEQVNERKESNNRPGATHTYGARRPIEYGSAPEGHVSRGKHDDFPHGTVSYDTELSDADRERYGLLKIPSEHDKHALAARVVDLAKDSKALPALYARGGSERVHNWLDAKAANIIEGSGIHAKSAEIAKLANEKLNERKAAPDLSEKIKSQPSAPPHAERNETAGKGDGTAAKEEKPESAKTAKSVDEHIATAAKTYGLSSEEADKLKSHPHVDTARKSPDKAEGYVRLAVKDHLSRDRKRNMSPSTAERFMREREKGEKIKKALGNIFAAIRGQRSAG